MENINSFIDRLANSFETSTRESFSPETKYRLLSDWDSLAALSIIAMVNSVYGIQMKGEDIRSSVTVQDLYNLVKSRVNSK